jgi:hypothetical protein
MKRRYLSPVLALLVGGMIGCGGGGENLPPTVKLSGMVKLDGQPLSEGRISFHPSEKAGGSAINASIVDGMYSAPVVPKGSYRVAFTSGEVMNTEVRGAVDSSFNAPTDKAKKQDPIPEKYHKPSLPVEATADKSDLNFDLSGD